MIVLGVEDYCQNCGDFDPVKNTIEYHSGFKIVDRHTTVNCRWHDRCERIKEYLEKDKKRQEQKLPEPIEIEEKKEESVPSCADCRYLDSMSDWEKRGTLP